jgi:hypothetical protein
MKFVKIAGITTIVVLALAVLGVTLAFAQKPVPTDPPWWNMMRNRMSGSVGMMGGSAINNGGWQSMQEMHNRMTQNGGMSAMHEWMHQSGGIHDTVWKALADQLGLTPDELTAQLNSGKTLAQIAQEKGIKTTDLAAVMETTMKTGLAQAVKDGQLTQEQADRMLKHMDGQFEWMITNMGGRMGTGSGGMMGPGSGGCHNNDQTTGDNTSL